MSTVEWKTLGEVCDIGTGNNNREDAIIDGHYPFFVRSKEVFRINKYLFDEEAVIIPGEGGIGDIFHYINGKYGLHQRAYRIHPKASKYNCKYIYYYLAANFKQYIIQKSVSATVTSIRKPMLEGFSICVPSLEVQQAIVNQLDTFTTLISRLESELELRQKQYEHYRDVLLNFEDDEEVEWKTLGDIGDVAMCKRIFKEQTQDKGEIPFYKIGTFGKTADAFISRELYEEFKSKYNFPKKGDILMSASGSIGRTVVYDGSDAYYQDSNIVWINNDESKVSNKFLRLIYSITKWNVDDGGVIARLYNKNIKATAIPIPSKQRQQQIVSQLDTFEQLIAALKREIALRRKQYEYYREKLLTFDE